MQRLEACDKELEDYKMGHDAKVESRGGNSNAWRASTQARAAALEKAKADRAEFWTGQTGRMDTYKAALAAAAEAAAQ